ncbi:CMRF35-like molecule 2 isoform X1 [Sardina pilchardus]|uniref:CMRF35-like molecule 2 isoform X1 n=1 Tax=Sardina pilchardus TaxID=27697 RepID=UPI002E0D9D03
MRPGPCLKIFLLCSVLTVTDGTTVVSGTEGGNASIRCNYSQRYSSYSKYFCQGEHPFCKDMVHTDATHKLVKQGRYSLYDNGQDSFQVDITELSFEDDGLYQCAVDIPFAIDVYEEVYINVTDGQATISPTLLSNVPINNEGTAFPKLQPTTHLYATTYPQASPVGTPGPTGTALPKLQPTTHLYATPHPQASPVGTPGPTGESSEHSPKLYLVLSAIVGLIVVLMVGTLTLPIILYAKRAKSSDSVNLPAAMETAEVEP